ncbi:MAG TPA: glycosyltransferase, partial [Urbifossiella sp.]
LAFFDHPRRKDAAREMNLVHLTSSTFFGGPERQMLGLAESLPDSVRTSFVSFAEGGRCEAFLEVVRARGFEAIALKNDFPRLFKTLRELTDRLRERDADLLLCHGYKANILGRIAARRLGIPAVAVSRGWTGENRKVRAYEWLDRRHLRFMDQVICVSDGQADKVRRWCGVPDERLTVIRNSARMNAFAERTPGSRRTLLGMFVSAHHRSGDLCHQTQKLPAKVILAAGRFSPEKGFGVLVEAAAMILNNDPSAGIVLFGEGVLRPNLERRIAELGIADRFLLPGFRSDLDSLIAAADVVVLPSFTEGLPNVALEASAAGVPVVATAVGGTPEVIVDGETGFLVPPGQPETLAEKITELLRDEPLRRKMGATGQARMRELFTFEAQSEAYVSLFERLATQSLTRLASPVDRQRPCVPVTHN